MAVSLQLLESISGHNSSRRQGRALSPFHLWLSIDRTILMQAHRFVADCSCIDFLIWMATTCPEGSTPHLFFPPRFHKVPEVLEGIKQMSCLGLTIQSSCINPVSRHVSLHYCFVSGAVGSLSEREKYGCTPKWVCIVWHGHSHLRDQCLRTIGKLAQPSWGPHKYV